jgi:hypothetical protein
VNKKTTTTNTNTPKRKKGHTTTHTVLNTVVNTMPVKRMRCFCHENTVLLQYYYNEAVKFWSPGNNYYMSAISLNFLNKHVPPCSQTRGPVSLPDRR